MYIGKHHRQFDIRTAQLQWASPFLRKLLTEDTGHTGTGVIPEQVTFEDLDESAMALFVL
jgi:hypothetical protein